MDIVQVLGSLISIFILALIASKLFPSVSKLTKERIERNVTRFCPNIGFTDSDARIFVSDDYQSGVLVFPEPKDGIALLTALGDRVVVRHIPEAEHVAKRIDTDTVTFQTGDFTQPAVKLILDKLAADELMDSIMRVDQEEGHPAHA